MVFQDAFRSDTGSGSISHRQKIRYALQSNRDIRIAILFVRRIRTRLIKENAEATHEDRRNPSSPSVGNAIQLHRADVFGRGNRSSLITETGLMIG